MCSPQERDTALYVSRLLPPHCRAHREGISIGIQDGSVFSGCRRSAQQPAGPDLMSWDVCLSRWGLESSELDLFWWRCNPPDCHPRPGPDWISGRGWEGGACASLQGSARARVCSSSVCPLNTAACLFLCASRCALAWVQTTCGWKLDPQFSPAASSYLDFVLPCTLLVSQNILLLRGSDERARKLSKLTFKLGYCFIDSILSWLLAETLSFLTEVDFFLSLFQPAIKWCILPQWQVGVYVRHFALTNYSRLLFGNV